MLPCLRCSKLEQAPRVFGNPPGSQSTVELDGRLCFLVDLEEVRGGLAYFLVTLLPIRKGYLYRIRFWQLAGYCPEICRRGTPRTLLSNNNNQPSTAEPDFQLSAFKKNDDVGIASE